MASKIGVKYFDSGDGILEYPNETSKSIFFFSIFE